MTIKNELVYCGDLLLTLSREVEHIKMSKFYIGTPTKRAMQTSATKNIMIACNLIEGLANRLYYHIANQDPKNAIIISEARTVYNSASKLGLEIRELLLLPQAPIWDDRPDLHDYMKDVGTHAGIHVMALSLLRVMTPVVASQNSLVSVVFDGVLEALAKTYNAAYSGFVYEDCLVMSDGLIAKHKTWTDLFVPGETNVLKTEIAHYSTIGTNMVAILSANILPFDSNTVYKKDTLVAVGNMVSISKNNAPGDINSEGWFLLP